MSHPHLSIVIPLFNERDSLEQLQREIVSAVDPTGDSYEIIYVDDGSTDGSAEVLAGLAATDQRIRVLRQARNAGQSAAFAAGFKAAHGEIVVTLDADLQNDPADIPRLLEACDHDDVVCGVRVARHDSAVKKLSSRIANTVRNLMTNESISDVGCSLRAFRRELATELPVFNGMHRFLPTLLRLQGASITEVPVNHRPRRHGESKYGINNRLWSGLADLLAVRWMIKRHIDPSLVGEISSDTSSDHREQAS